MIENNNKNIRWVQLSDFHVGKDNYAQRKLFNEIIDYLWLLSSQGFSPDLLFITGDIANKALTDQYDAFKSEFLDPLSLKLPGDISDRIFIVPGNHDVDRDTHKYFPREEICSQESQFFDPTSEGLKERIQILPRFKNYINSSLSPSDWIDSEHGFFTHRITINEIDIGIAGINTAWLSKKEDRHHLSPGINMLEDALENLHDVKFKIVLGHHPIDWFDDDHISPIRSILGRHNALYLHGHLHKNRVSPEDGAGYGFLCVQGGAAFQSRADEKWVNGILLAELCYPSECTLRLQPREWSPNNRDWALSKDLPARRKIPESDWWAFPLPLQEKKEGKRAISESIETCLRYPVGWQLIDSIFIKRQQESADQDHYLSYVDGAEPDWNIATSELIPRRQIVYDLTAQIANYNRKNKPQIVLISGPVGEGKTTALMQTVVALLDSENPINILWNQGSEATLAQEEVLSLPQTDIPWLLVSDSADLIAKDIKSICQALARSHRNDIRFLICCRDTDWNATKAHTWHWNKFAYLFNFTLSGLKTVDARKIVNFWVDIGQEALGELHGLDIEEAVEKFMEAAHSEAARREGALIGAMLKVRYGNLLKDHVKALLVRLLTRKVPGGSNLFDAFCYVAAMHAEGLKYLSRPVLAEALCCPLEYLNTHVLTPLGMEAATSNDGQFLLTRHKSIAEVSIELMQEVFQINFDQIYYELIDAAMTAKFNQYIPLLPQWTYSYPGHFGKKGRSDLAIKYGKRVLEKTPKNSTLICSLSIIYRIAGSRFEAIELFRNYKNDVFEPRGYYSEWGAAEGAYGNYFQSIRLLFYSVSDQASKIPPRKQIALKFFSSLFKYYEEVEQKYIDRHFKSARNSSKYLNKILRLKKKVEMPLDGKQDSNHFNKDIVENKSEQIDIDSEFSKLIDTFHLTLGYFSEEEGFDFIKGITAKELTFNGLLKLLSSAADRIQFASDG